MIPRSHVLSLSFALTFGLVAGASAQTHRGQMDTDGILSPGEIRNPRIDYGDGYNRRPDRRDPDRGRNDNCADSRYLQPPRIEIFRVKQTGNVFDDKVKINGAVEGTCITEAGLYENGRLVERIPTAEDPRFQRFEFEVKGRTSRRAEIRVYNTAGDRDVYEIEEAD